MKQQVNIAEAKNNLSGSLPLSVEKLYIN